MATEVFVAAGGLPKTAALLLGVVRRNCNSIVVNLKK